MKGRKYRGKLFLHKIVIFLLSLFVLSFVVFFMSRLAPGNPLVSYYGERAERMNPVEKEKSMDRLGLTQPIIVQYGKWIQHAVKGEFGISYKYKQDVMQVIQGRLGNTLILGGIGFILTFALALLLGIFCALHEGSVIDVAICKIGTVTSCIPEFWLSLVLILIFSVNLKWLPSSGAYQLGGESSLASRSIHLILPMMVVVMSHLWYYAYMFRNKLLEEARQDYVLLAKSKGMSQRSCMYHHCVRNMLPSYISIMAISVPHILGGTYIVEMVFSYPGIGTLSYESAKYHDYNMLMVLCLITGAIVILGNMVGQFVSEKIDPRMKDHELNYTEQVKNRE